MKRHVENALTLTLLTVAVILVVAALWRDPRQAAPPEIRLPNWERLAEEGHRLGPAAPAVTMIVFSDYSCPSCERARFAVDTVLAAYQKDLALVYRHSPMRLTYLHSDSAANAAECAAEQGRFFEFSRALYDRQNYIGRIPWREFAATAMLGNPDEFERCLREMRHASTVERDAWVADSIGLVGMPTIIVDGEVHSGPMETARLDGIVRKALTRRER